MSRRAAALTCLALLAGCNLTGPTALRYGRQEYNLAIQQTQNEQLLLNLVRLRYLDTPQFLEVGSVTANYQFEAGIGGTANFPYRRNDFTTNTFNANARIGWLERPTITMQPLQGERFVTQMLTPIPLETLLLLVHSGWSIERVLRVCVQHVGGVPNAPTAAGPAPAVAPEFREFQRLAALLRRMQLGRGFELGLEGEEGKRELVLRLTAQAAEDDASELRALLGQAADARKVVLVPSLTRGSGERVGIGTRSLMGALFYLSQGVHVPDEDLDLITVTRGASGARFGWEEVLGGLFRVSADEAPEGGASVGISYRGHDFYIADRDVSTKATFALLQQLVALQAGNVQGSAPVLTISVGG
ncbi:MAG: hypothetical protein M9894_34730 [Planctomycetes bacterium]|nr:hypothetical protein [Planctomycetota bacterium]